MRRFLRNTLRTIVLGWLLLVLLACCVSRTVQQAGLVPYSEPTPPPTSHGHSDFYAGASGLTYFEPSEGSDDLGHHVPASQVHLATSVRPIDGLQIRPLAMWAVPQGAQPVTSGLIDRPDLPSFGAGFDIGYMYGDEDEPLLVRPHLGLLVMMIATSLQDFTISPSTFTEDGWMAVVEGGIDLGYWVTPWLLVLGSLEARNMPVVPASVTASSCDDNDPPFVSFGDLTVNARVGFEIEIEERVGVVGTVGFPVYGSPFTSYPIVSLGVRARFGDGRSGMVPARREAVDYDLEREDEGIGTQLDEPG